MQDIFLFIQTHWALSVLCFSIVILLTIVEFIRSKQNATKISPLQTTQLINHKNAVIIDIRSSDIFKSGHIMGAHSIPLNEFDSKYKKIDKLKKHPLIIVCDNGVDSSRAAQKLTKHNIQPLILAGGIRAWRSAEMPLVKD